MLELKSKHATEAAKVEGFKLQNSELRKTNAKLQQQLQQVDVDNQNILLSTIEDMFKDQHFNALSGATTIRSPSPDRSKVIPSSSERALEDAMSGKG